MNTYYNEFFEIGQQKIKFNLYEIGLPSGDPVYTLKKVMEDLDFSSLTARYSTKGRKSYNPIMMYAIMLYANMRGVKAVDRIVELCERDIAFMWLTNGEKPRRDAFYHFFNNELTADIESTFMRMKEDHMLNGQLKPAYNVQIAVENYFIVHAYISNDRTDYNTLVPVLSKHKTALDHYPEQVTADSGYCSEKNLLFLKENNIKSYIKLQTHEKMKTKAYQNDIGKYYNMTSVIYEDTHYYRCADNRILEHQRTETHKKDGFERTFEVYACSDCGGCIHKANCLYKYNEAKDTNRNKVMKINEQWEELKMDSNQNIQSEEGVLNRQIRSIQTEGHFGDIKENDKFRRFNYRSSEKVYKEFMLYTMARNLNIYYRFTTGKIQKFEGKTVETVA